MTIADLMLRTHPKDLGDLDQAALLACIQACVDCAQACSACADACLSEDMIADLTKCVRTNLDCADLCETTGRILSRRTGYDANVTRATLEACRTAKGELSTGNPRSKPQVDPVCSKAFAIPATSRRRR